MTTQTTKKQTTGMLPVIFSLAWPTMLEQLMQTAVQYIDTAMVGSLGIQATAAVGATSTVNWLLSSSLSALGVGFLSFIARAYGAGDKQAASRASAQAAFIVLSAGILFTALTLSLSGVIPAWMQVDESIRQTAGQYFFILYLPMLPRTASIIFGTVLRAAGDTKSPMKIGVLVNLVNVILNFLLIYPSRPLTVMGLTFTMPGAGLGVVGAALASAIVTSGSDHISVKVHVPQPEADAPPLLIIDSYEKFPLCDGDEIRLYKAPCTLRTVKTKEQNFYAKLQQKLAENGQ